MRSGALLLIWLHGIFVSTVQAINLRFPFGATKVRGVNLGGWLVLEPFVTPSLFDATGNPAIIDEWTFSAYQSYATAQSALVRHWETFITEADFAAIAGAGLNHVRIPIGYWAFDISKGEPYHQGQFGYLKRAVGWAANHGVKVLIDLHGVPGSQNGWNHSGRQGPANWASNSTNLARTRAVLRTLAAEFSQSKYANVVTSITPLNEPAPFQNGNILPAARQYYLDAYGIIRNPGGGVKGNLYITYHDAFLGDWGYWTFLSNKSKFQGISLDTHIYDIFSSGGVKLSYAQHISGMCARGRQIRQWASRNIGVMVGEWTFAPTDCAKYLNGRNNGARYDGSLPGSTYVGSCTGKSGSGASFSASYKTFLRKYYEAQTQAWEQSVGWIHWTWKTEVAADWSYQAGLAQGWIPQNPASRKYDNICGY
ncbi:glycoside hydrolase family 5 protein [Cantharellus anzutake]|uniref:glycoside hydrolase family 5 protein n=1 Tax=Cantharellus anzutake TaxID=1750568 RepID=UPI0019033C31|nr:glycoside hydrolase family 5 protein [Cantharellus anzutake]KAF8337443.1 glycoside hydrolase family 5 protein [Cantharellus anzutake]